MFGGEFNAGTFSGSQIGGGGFMQDQGQTENYNSMNATGSNFAQKNSAGAPNIPYDQRRLSQITIKQITTAPPPQPDANLIVDGVEIAQLVLIAQIVSVDIQTSHTTLLVNDKTGSIEVKKWTSDNDTAPINYAKEAELTEGRWVKVVGRINCYNGKCSVNVYDIIPVTDYNEVTHHFLECLYSHLQNTVGHLQRNKTQQQSTAHNNNNVSMHAQQGGGQSQFNGMNGMAGANNSTMNNNNNAWNGGGGGGYGGSTAMMMNNNNNNLSQLENSILGVVGMKQWEQCDQGCNVDEIFSRLKNEDRNAIRQGIDSLADAGLIYSTVDDEHYKYSGDQQ
eukprot:CAMPEP_0202693720 /NCGR_PEP_ID=MMETSP1385-20130828/7754_1 /ASSEMBLY_ACC=CAM_ASM_000861 /TAXON_ID=933848 /ORGANISM="Elphidium margaritaceum" /LENGTH=335 /DNA_ID=CAMNT_0049349441 /DNA_START=86 /DNA_END=1093 /DNA_ORIENTATION=-